MPGKRAMVSAMSLSPYAKAWRVTITGAVAAGLFYGTVWGTDDFFPLGPMVQYAFSIPPDGEIRSLHLFARTTAGQEVEIPLEPYYVGVRRAEIESHLGRHRQDPSLLQHLADAHRRLRPGDAAPATLTLRTKVIKLKDRVPSATRFIEEVSWQVR
ncbi:hypothetical protein Ssi02_30010 [Sinosporangium siamense]|uniref:Uncharacterized protein n=2 Tax=Sinosporangium siamense TaxID=1367973 RepID=A0A919RF57_9ACTN|nr:hypothetical protein Ssi02_30010 [Sinosporangium siamense]